MAWNGSDSGKVKVAGQERKSIPLSTTATISFNYKALCAGLLVVVLALMVVFLMMPSAATKAEKSQDVSKRIAAIERRDRPQAAPLAQKEGIAQGTNPRAEAEEAVSASATPSVRPGEKVLTNAVPESAKTFAQKVFTRPADIWIADLLTIEPGVQLVGSMMYQDFTKEFLQSVKEPITIGQDDDEDVRLLKNAVKEVREDLLKRHAAGEDLNKVMMEARSELQKLGTYREQLKQQVREIEARDEDGRLTEKDYQDLIDAANLMLKEHGAKPITMPAFIKYKFEKELLDDEN